MPFPGDQELTVRQKHLLRKWQYLPAHCITRLRKTSGRVIEAYGADPSRVLSAAWWGLYLAALNYRAEVGVQFNTYAIKIIKQRILNESLHPFAPVYIPKTAFDSDTTRPSAELACCSVSLDAPLPHSGGKRSVRLADVLPERLDNTERLDHEFVAAIHKTMKRLPSLLYATLRLRFWENLTYQEIADRTDGVCKERVRQRIVQALDLLRTRMATLEKKYV